MSEKQNTLRKYFNGLVFLIALAAIGYLFARKFDTIVNILIVMIGFGAVIMIHEFGHFICAKLSGIKVETFSIGFPPTLLGIQKTEDGIRFRILPKFFPPPSQDEDEDKTEDKDESKDTNENEGGLIFTLGGKYKPSDTEYCIGLIPFGGFVKMLGQEDAAVTEETDDPRSFTNKPISIRIAVVAAGVIFNAISAILIFMIVFLIGIDDLPPTVVGDVRPDSPAEIAGIRPGDRIVELEGETFLDFSNMQLASMLAAKGTPISMIVEHSDGTREPFEIIPEESTDAAMGMRTLGIYPPESLVISELSASEDDLLYDTLGLRSKDLVTAFNGVEVKNAWQLKELVKNSSDPQGVLTVERTDPETGQKTLADVKLPLRLSHANDNFKTGYDLAHIYSIVPRLEIAAVLDKTPKTFREKLIAWWEAKILRRAPPQPDTTGPFLEPGDIIIKVAETENPTYTELRQITTNHEDKPLPVTVLREGQGGILSPVEITVFPHRQPGSDRVTIGIFTILDTEHTVVADTIDTKDGLAALRIPRGARITVVDGKGVSDFYDIIRIIRQNRGQHINIEYISETAQGRDGGSVSVHIPAENDYITAENAFADFIPFERLKEKVQADNAGQAISMGFKKAYNFITKTYLTLSRLFTKQISPKTLMGPIAIVSVSYKIVATVSLTYYVYFMGLISCALAVMNLLPIPIVDGGVIVMLIIEKIKGSPISMRTQQVVTYAGLILLGTLVFYVTYNDILNWLFPQ